MKRLCGNHLFNTLGLGSCIIDMPSSALVSFILCFNFILLLDLLMLHYLTFNHDADAGHKFMSTCDSRSKLQQKQTPFSTFTFPALLSIVFFLIEDDLLIWEAHQAKHMTYPWLSCLHGCHFHEMRVDLFDSFVISTFGASICLKFVRSTKLLWKRLYTLHDCFLNHHGHLTEG